MAKKLMLDIEIGSNGGFIVTHYKNNPSSIQKLTGVAQDKETLAFANPKDLVEWLTKWKNTEF